MCLLLTCFAQTEIINGNSEGRADKMLSGQLIVEKLVARIQCIWETLKKQFKFN